MRSTLCSLSIHSLSLFKTGLSYVCIVIQSPRCKWSSLISFATYVQRHLWLNVKVYLNIAAMACWNVGMISRGNLPYFLFSNLLYLVMFSPPGYPVRRWEMRRYAQKSARPRGCGTKTSPPPLRGRNWRLPLTRSATSSGSPPIAATVTDENILRKYYLHVTPLFYAYDMDIIWHLICNNIDKINLFGCHTDLTDMTPIMTPIMTPTLAHYDPHLDPLW
jgi:hypothetical protein